MPGEAVCGVLAQLWKVLEPLGHPVALMGGISLAAWNRIRATEDVDFLIGVDAASIEPVIQSLCTAGCRPKRIPPLVSVGDHRFVQFLYTPPDEAYDVQFDLLLAETELQKSAIERRVRRTVPGLNSLIDVLHCDDLILFKLLAGRIIDRADAAMQSGARRFPTNLAQPFESRRFAPFPIGCGERESRPTLDLFTRRVPAPPPRHVSPDSYPRPLQVPVLAGPQRQPRADRARSVLHALDQAGQALLAAGGLLQPSR